MTLAHSSEVSERLECDQNLPRSNLFPGLKIATLGTKMLCIFLKILAILRAHFNPRLTAWAEMSLSRVQDIFTHAKINSIVFMSR